LTGGKHPFYKTGDAKEKLVDRLENDDIDFDALECSENMKDLLKRLLDKNPNQRYSAGEALNHPAITGKSLADRPLTAMELMELYMAKLQMQKVMWVCMFTNYVEVKFKQEMAQREDKFKGARQGGAGYSHSRLASNNFDQLNKDIEEIYKTKKKISIVTTKVKIDKVSLSNSYHDSL
jgi:serine/threonine protein kinase